MIALTSIETTPNPNSMKLNLSDSLGVTDTYTADNKISAPELVQKLLEIEGLQSIFATADFVTLNRDPRFDWQTILLAAQNILRTDEASTEIQRQRAERQGQIQVLVQTFHEIPIQVKVTDGDQEKRLGLSQRFGDTARELQAHFGADYLKERFWADWGVRYGEIDNIAQEVAEEIESLIDEVTLEQKKQSALGKTISKADDFKRDSHLDDADWHERFRALQQLEATEENLPAFVQAFHDEQVQVRRWVAARLASIKTTQSVEALCERLLNDPNVGVRRTAGDSLSDIGDVAAQSVVCQALGDANKLVRWRAARFLAEVGTEASLPFLEKAKNDSEYEVRLEVEAAINHITAGSNVVPVWKLMSQGHSD
jgi:hypothetical protein